MIVGNGLIATAFRGHDFKNSPNIVIYASGVSRSKEVREEAFLRGQAMLAEAVASGKLICAFRKRCKTSRVGAGSYACPFSGAGKHRGLPLRRLQKKRRVSIYCQQTLLATRWNCMRYAWRAASGSRIPECPQAPKQRF